MKLEDITLMERVHWVMKGGAVVVGGLTSPGETTLLAPSLFT